MMMYVTKHEFKYNKPFVTLEIVSKEGEGQTWYGIFEREDETSSITLTFNCHESKTSDEVIKSVKFKNLDEEMVKGWKVFKSHWEYSISGPLVNISFLPNFLTLRTDLPQNSIIDLKQRAFHQHIVHSTESLGNLLLHSTKPYNRDTVTFISENNELCCFDINDKNSLITIFKNTEKYDRIYLSDPIELSMVRIFENFENINKKLLFVDENGRGSLSYDPKDGNIKLFNARSKKFFEYAITVPLAQNDEFYELFAQYNHLWHLNLLGTIVNKQEGCALNLIDTVDFQSVMELNYKTATELLRTLRKSRSVYFVMRDEKRLDYEDEYGTFCLHTGQNNEWDNYKIINTSGTRENKPQLYGHFHGAEFSIPKYANIVYASKIADLLDVDDKARAALEDTLIIGYEKDGKCGFVTNDGVLIVPPKWKVGKANPATSAAKRNKVWLEKHLDEYLIAKKAFEQKELQNQNTSIEEMSEEELLASLTDFSKP